jgi:hypothetical protein
MNFFQTSSPGWICLYGFVAPPQKISVPCAVFTGWKTHDRGFAVAKRMRQGFGQRKLPGPLGQIVTEVSSQAHADSIMSIIIANKIRINGGIELSLIGFQDRKNAIYVDFDNE